MHLTIEADTPELAFARFKEQVPGGGVPVTPVFSSFNGITHVANPAGRVLVLIIPHA